MSTKKKSAPKNNTPAPAKKRKEEKEPRRRLTPREVLCRKCERIAFGFERLIEPKHLAKLGGAESALGAAVSNSAVEFNAVIQAVNALPEDWKPVALGRGRPPMFVVGALVTPKTPSLFLRDGSYPVLAVEGRQVQLDLGDGRSMVLSSRELMPAPAAA